MFLSCPRWNDEQEVHPIIIFLLRQQKLPADDFRVQFLILDFVPFAYAHPPIPPGDLVEGLGGAKDCKNTGWVEPGCVLLCRV